MREIVVTAEGLARLERQLEQLRTSGRRDVAERVSHAWTMGTELAENAEFLAAREEQALLERRIATLEEQLAHARVIETGEVASGTIGVGSRVRLRDLETRRTEEYEIVGEGEGNPSKGRLSSESPVGSALLGHQAEEVVEAAAPRGPRRLKILGVHEREVSERPQTAQVLKGRERSWSELARWGRA